MNEKEAREICEKALALSEAEHVQVNLTGTREASTRYANNEITQNVAKAQTTLRVLCAYGNKVGRCSTNRLDTDSIREAVKRAEEMARVAEPDTEFLPRRSLPYIAQCRRIRGQHRTRHPRDRACVVRQVIAEANARGLKTAGSHQHLRQSRCQ